MNINKKIMASFLMAGLISLTPLDYSSGPQAEVSSAGKVFLAMRGRFMDKNFQNEAYRLARRNAVKGVRADYNSEPRLSGHPALIAPPSATTGVDIKQLVKHCEDLGVNCYHFLIWHCKTDWEDFKAFVEEAETSSILRGRSSTVWVYLVPPSESQEMRSEPFGMDYVAWMENVAKFSASHPPVKAVCIDDFYWAPENRALFTSDYLKKMRRAADKYNPHLALVSVLYWNDVDPKNGLEVIKAASVIGEAIDGILYPYMAESQGKGLSHKDTSVLGVEIKRVREVYPGIPIILDIYVSRHTSCPDLPDPKWVGELIDLSKVHADGVALYCAPKKNKDGSFSGFWSEAMQSPAGIFEAVRSRYHAWK
jgi:hypothetical protein